MPFEKQDEAFKILFVVAALVIVALAFGPEGLLKQRRGFSTSPNILDRSMGGINKRGEPHVRDDSAGVIDSVRDSATH